ncbi:porin family protein [Ciceribacter sp. L1K23]|uniref:outer membrane protein n=1 Tax=unclassified Ciceribacter TaxID=2628820 RepID=UPI001ABDF3C0|nr:MULTISPECIES: outer membrane protein [unclassified Ciceribacter]MBO3762041.1 porin family protein [Ciceribacter sp. L1K22]MBR0558111.1 porin family protein [Ciceribacter sp. L1K23]
MFKKLLTTSTAIVLLSTGAAFAADAIYEVPEAPAATIETPVVFSWAGGYVGVEGGYGWGDADVDGFGSDGFDGGRFGGFVGYNWEFGNSVIVGLEGNVDYDWNDGSVAGADFETGFNGGIRGRVGYAMDRALIYAAGGWTATDANLDTGAGEDSETMHGWTIGAGVDYAFTDRMFGRLEYRYNDYGDKDIGGTNVDFSQHVVNVGLGVKF